MLAIFTCRHHFRPIALPTAGSLALRRRAPLGSPLCPSPASVRASAIQKKSPGHSNNYKKISSLGRPTLGHHLLCWRCRWLRKERIKSTNKEAGLLFIRAQNRCEEAEMKGFQGKGQQLRKHPSGGSIRVVSL